MRLRLSSNPGRLVRLVIAGLNRTRPQQGRVAVGGGRGVPTVALSGIGVNFSGRFARSLLFAFQPSTLAGNFINLKYVRRGVGGGGRWVVGVAATWLTK